MEDIITTIIILVCSPFSSGSVPRCCSLRPVPAGHSPTDVHRPPYAKGR